MAQSADAAHHQAISLVYDSALDPAIWPSALEAICKLVEGCHGSISVHDPVRREIQFAADWCPQPDWERWRVLLNAKYAAMMPFFAILPNLEVDSVLNTAQMAALIGRSQDIYEHPFFTEWALPSGRRDAMASVVMKAPDRVGMLSVHTSTCRDLTGPRELASIALLAPHVRRAVTIGDLLGMAEAKADTLDVLAAAVIVTDGAARILHANRAAETMLRARSPVGSQNGILDAGQPTATLALLNAIGRTDGHAGNIGATGISVPLRFDNGSPAVAHVLPLARGGSHRDWGPRATAAVFIAPTRFVVPDADALMALYGLTAMEARVLLEISTGKKRAEAAQALGIADSTAKSHLDRVFSKTGTCDQAALFRLVNSLASLGRSER